MTNKPGNLVKSVDRSVDILEQLAKYENGLGVTELSKRLDIHKSSIHRLLSTLVYRGLVEQDNETGNYKLGLKIFELGSRIFNDLEIRDYARPYLEELMNETGETIHLVVLDQNEVLYVDKVESRETIAMKSQIGARAPVYCTAVGKAMLSFLKEKKVNKIIKNANLQQRTENTITDSKKLKKNLDIIRDRGYAVDDIENKPGIRCVAAPIFNYDEQVVAAISISGPTIRITEDRVAELGNLVKDFGLKISRRLGYNATK